MSQYRQREHFFSNVSFTIISTLNVNKKKMLSEKHDVLIMSNCSIQYKLVIFFTNNYSIVSK